MSERRIYNRVVRVPLRIEWWRGVPHFIRYEAEFYNSAYGYAATSAFSRQKCERRFRLLRESMCRG